MLNFSTEIILLSFNKMKDILLSFNKMKDITSMDSIFEKKIKKKTNKQTLIFPKTHTLKCETIFDN